MNKLLMTRMAAVAMGVFTATRTHAADLPVYAPPEPIPATIASPFSWTGFYVGLQAGYGWGEVDGRLTDFPNIPGFSIPYPYDYDVDGFVGGAYAGFNYQWNRLVVGLEGNIEYSEISGSGEDSTGSYGFSTELAWLASARGRAGLAFDRLLVFGTGGLAFGDTENEAGFAGSPPLMSWSETRTGWTAGAGGEYAVTDAISVGLEYRYVDLGKVSRRDEAANGWDRNDLSFHTIRARIGYMF